MSLFLNILQVPERLSLPTHYPRPILHDYSCGQLTKFAVIVKKMIISSFALCNQCLKSAEKYAFLGEMTCMAIMGSGNYRSST